jgi:hypothetical protein
MSEQTRPKQPPLTIEETAAKLREKPHTLICSEEDALAMLQGLIQEGFYTVPVSDGHWELFDLRSVFVKAELRTFKFCEKGQNYVVENTALEWPKPPDIAFTPLDEPESIIWGVRINGKWYSDNLLFPLIGD